MIELDTTLTQGAKIRVIGIGGGGGNAINSMIERGLTGVDFIAANTDIQALQNNLAPTKIQIGKELTRGLGAGADPSVGAKAVEEDCEEVSQILQDSDMIFVTAGMGGGTGTGGASVVARIGREIGALVVGIVTKPFQWEARKRMKVADYGIEELRQNVDALIIIPNQKLMSVIDKHTSFVEAFQKVDDVLYNATRGIADIISGHGYINVDFADVRTIMSNTGDALMGSGFAKGDHRAVEAAQNAISSPLLEGVSIQGAAGVLVNITGSSDMTMFEIGEAVSVIENAAGSDVNLIQGIVFDDDLADGIMVTVVATGFKRDANGNAQLSNVVAENAVSELQTAAVEQQPLVVQQQKAAAAGGGGTMTQNFMPSATPAPTGGTRAMPTSSPSGVQELQKYDEPAFLRRRSSGSIRLNKPYSSANENPMLKSDSVDAQESSDEKAQTKPAFLRKIMD